MSDQSNTKLLKQLTQRKRDSSRSNNTRGNNRNKKAENKARNEAEERKETNPVITLLKDSTPAWMKKPSAKVAFDIALFSASAFVIIKFGSSLAKTLDENCPTEKSIMDMMN